MVGNYLMFNKNCQEALNIYEKALHAEIVEIQKYSDMPVNPDFPIEDEDKNLILHARFKFDNGELMCADSIDGMASGNNMYVTVTTSDKKMVKKAWDILKKDGKIYMELQPSFFALLHGSLQDKFGINWMFTVQENKEI